MENDRADAGGRDGRTRLARPNSQARTGSGGNAFSLVQLTTSRIDNHNQLIHTLLLKVLTMHRTRNPAHTEMTGIVNRHRRGVSTLFRSCFISCYLTSPPPPPPPAAALLRRIINRRGKTTNTLFGYRHSPSSKFILLCENIFLPHMLPPPPPPPRARSPP